jgi:hypothetical protein
VRLAVGSDVSIKFFGKMGGTVPMPEEILSQIESFAPKPRREAAGKYPGGGDWRDAEFPDDMLVVEAEIS